MNNTTPFEDFMAAMSAFETTLGLDENTVGSSFNQRLKEVASKNHKIKKNREKLSLIRELRNKFAHEAHKMHDLIKPGQGSIDLLIDACDAITKPPLAYDMFKANIREFTLADKLKDVYAYLHDKDYSQVFYRDEHENLRVLSANTIQRWCAAQVELGLIDLETKIIDIYGACEVTGELDFLPRSTSVYEAQAVFSREENQNLISLIITEKGKPNQKPLACVAPWDIARLAS